MATHLQHTPEVWEKDCKPTLLYKKRPLISDLGAVHGHYFDPVPTYLYALQRYILYFKKQKK